MIPYMLLSGGLAAAAPPTSKPIDQSTAIVVKGQRPAAPEANRVSSTTRARLDGAELDRRKAPTLGETLSRIPGIHNDYFGPGVGSPTIRGQTRGRVAVLINGLATQDAAGLGAEHATAVEPFLADRIEVLKGSASVLYGGGAIGGAVNVIDGRIPITLHEGGPTARAELRVGDNVGATTTARLDGGHGAFAWHIDGLYRYQGDQVIPDHAKADTCRSWQALVSASALQALCQVRLARPTYVYNATLKRYVDATPVSGQVITNLDPQGDADHRLPNSALRTTTINAGGSIIVEGGYLGLSIGRFDSAYGVPGFTLITASRPTASPIGIRVGQTRLDVNGALYDRTVV